MGSVRSEAPRPVAVGSGATSTRPVADRSATLAWSGITIYLPLIIGAGFFAATILLFLVGPIAWQVNSPGRFWGYLLAFLAALIAGYLLAVRRPRSRGTASTPVRLDPSRLLIVASAVFLLVYPLTMIATTGKWYPDILTGLLNTGEAYRNTKYYSENGPRLPYYIRFLCGPFLISVLPLTLLFWQRLSRLAKILGVVCITLNVFMFMAQGINKGIADITGFAVLFLALAAASQLSRRNWRQLGKTVASIVVICLAFVALYTNNIGNRIAHDEAGKATPPATTAATEPAPPPATAPAATAPAPAPTTTAPPPAPATTAPAPAPATTPGEPQFEEPVDALIFKYAGHFGERRASSPFYALVPDSLQPSAMVLVFYLTHGYEGMALAVDHEFTSTYGLGFSDFYRHNILKVIGDPADEDAIFARTYYGKIKIEDSWPTGIYWPTFFVYPASDIGFPGTVVLVFGIGWLFGFAWRRALTRFDPFAGVMFAQLFTMVLYLSANNQLFQGGETALGVAGVLAAWLVMLAWEWRSGRGRATPAPAQPAEPSLSA